MTDSSNKLIRNSTAEFLIFTAHAGEPRPAHDETPTSERQA